MVEREIVMAGILMNVMSEMVVIRMMSIEEHKGIMTISMVQEIPASVEAAPLMMMITQLEMAVARVDDLPRDDRHLDHWLSEQSIGAPPSYEEATKDVHNHVQEDRNVREVKATVPSLVSLSLCTYSKLSSRNCKPGFIFCASKLFGRKCQWCR